MRILNLVISEFDMGLGLTGLKRTVGRRYALCLVTCQLYRVVSVNKDLRWASSACVSSSLCRINQQPFRISRVRGRWSQSPECPAALWAERTTSLLLWEVILHIYFTYVNYTTHVHVQSSSVKFWSLPKTLQQDAWNKNLQTWNHFSFNLTSQ